MTTLVEDYDFVIGGDPDHDSIDLAVLDTGAGRVRAQLADAADGRLSTDAFLGEQAYSRPANLGAGRHW